MGPAAKIGLAFALLMAPLAGQTNRQIESALQEHLKHWGYTTVSWNPSWTPVSPQDAARLEAQLRTDPEDTNARVRLLNYYWHNGLKEPRASMVFWLIENHPDSPILGLDLAWLFPAGREPDDHYRGMHDPADFKEARVLWNVVFARNGDLPVEIFHNAARFFESSEPVRSEDLAKRLRKADPDEHGRVVSTFLTTILPSLSRK